MNHVLLKKKKKEKASPEYYINHLWLKLVAVMYLMAMHSRLHIQSAVFSCNLRHNRVNTCREKNV